MKNTFIHYFPNLFRIINFCTGSCPNNSMYYYLQKPVEYHHESIHGRSDSDEKKLSERHSFRLEWQEDANEFNDKNLERFDAGHFS